MSHARIPHQNQQSLDGGLTGDLLPVPSSGRNNSRWQAVSITGIKQEVICSALISAAPWHPFDGQGDAWPLQCSVVRDIVTHRAMWMPDQEYLLHTNIIIGNEQYWMLADIGLYR